ncbi:hypothetical protein GCM10011506_15960 [Marivirga lumbricoides]|uniref:Uncharacterized protein n=1 Tax=Marivirga lumbricoides TaxID=1046115 RepID=A0ABQ1LX68_9BACT|nr:hypothetical protein GCM10011506_15960 [Marivirga lumbricoides]
MPEDDAFDKLKADEVDYVLYLDTKVKAKSRGYDRGDFTHYYVNEGMAITLRNGKRTNAAIQYIPPFGDDNEYAEAFINFGLDAFQYQFEIITSKELKSNTNLYAKFNENGNELKEKTLLVLAEWIHKKISIEEVKEIYEGKIEAVPFADWKEAIMEKQEGKAYVVVVPIPLGRSYVYYHYLMDAATGRILGMGQPKVSFGVNIGAYNYSKNNSGFVNEKNLEIYNELMD